MARFGNAGVGTLVGPATFDLSMGVGESFQVAENKRLKFEGSFKNRPNHQRTRHR